MPKFLKWGLVALTSLLALLFIARILFAVQIGEAVFKRAVAQQLGVDPLADLPDGLHVVLIGTGSPLPDPNRAGPSTAIIAGEDIYIIDSGGGAVRNMGEMRISPARVSAVFLTHLHSDHIDGLGELALQRWAGGGHRTPLRVHGPDGTQQLVDSLKRAYTPDSLFRIAHHGQNVVPQSGFGMVASTIAINAGGDENHAALQTDKGLIVRAFRVDHDPVSPAFGYRFEYKGRSVTISGDTAFDPRVAAAAKDTDLLLHEALNADMVNVMKDAATEAGNRRLAKIFHDIQDYHATPVQAAQTAANANAGALVYTHIVPALPSKLLYPYWLKGAGDFYDGPITIGEDGMLFSLPAGGSKMTRRRLK